MKYTIKEAHWKSKILGAKPMNITTTVIYQNEDSFIDSSSDYLFEIICYNFFNKYEKQNFNLEFNSNIGLYLKDNFQLLIYDLMIKTISNKDISFLKNKENKEESFLASRLNIFSNIYLAKIIFLLDELKIDLKKEEKANHKLLFNIKKDMKKFKITDNEKLTAEVREIINEILK